MHGAATDGHKNVAGDKKITSPYSDSDCDSDSESYSDSDSSPQQNNAEQKS